MRENCVLVVCFLAVSLEAIASIKNLGFTDDDLNMANRSGGMEYKVKKGRDPKWTSVLSLNSSIPLKREERADNEALVNLKIVFSDFNNSLLTWLTKALARKLG